MQPAFASRAGLVPAGLAGGAAMRAGLIPILLIAVNGCMPRDPDGTLKRVRGGTMRVGGSVREPWTRMEPGGPAGVEVSLVREFAAELDAKTEWVPGSESTLMEALEQRQLDLVIGGLTDDTPWKDRVGLTGIYLKTDPPERARHVMAVPPGENEWLLALERFLYAREQRARGLLHEESQR